MTTDPGTARQTRRQRGLARVARRVPDDQRCPAARQRDDVVPVAADDAVTDRQVAMSDLQTPGDLRPRGEQAALQRLRGPPLPLIQPGVVDAHRRPRGKLPRQRDIRRPEAGRPPPRPNVAHPTTAPRAISGMARNEV